MIVIQDEEVDELGPWSEPKEKSDETSISCATCTTARDRSPSGNAAGRLNSSMASSGGNRRAAGTPVMA